ncbi:MAG: tetratricopeptide repeat protein [Acetobacteraceae bacterium]|nr:tetratricopeptide repeat protein [Acetobacteraceae bacterium]
MPQNAASPTAIDLLAAGLAEHRAGDHAAAERQYRAALDLAPLLPQALHLLGVLLTETGRAQAACLVLRQAALLRPGDADIRLALARACAECGELPVAIALLRVVLAERPGDIGLLLGLAHLHARAGDELAALAACRDAAQAAPANPQARAALAGALAARGESEAALAEAAACLALDPRQGDAWLARGVALRALGRPAEAVAVLEHALTLVPGHPAVLLALGNARADCGHADMALALLREAAARGPAMAQTHASLSAVLAAEGFLPEAIAAADAAIACDPGFAPGWWSRAVARLLSGDLERGFADAEWRKRHPRFADDFAALTGPEWDGSPLAGRDLLVHAGQGMGDTIQFARYLPALAAAGARVTLACAGALVPLLSQIAGITVVRRAEGLPRDALWIDQMSLPHRLGTATIPHPQGYLTADPDAVAAWRARLGSGLRVGLVWAGNPAHANDAARSLPPGAAAQVLRPLLLLAGTVARLRFVPMQLGPRGGELAGAEGLAGPGGDLPDMAATAALLAALDLVITVDTATAHLAGALGVPVWVMLPYAPDWRWQLGRADSPWYASMRLFRQPVAGDWDAVLRAVAAALRVRCAARDGLAAAGMPKGAAAAPRSPVRADLPPSVAGFAGP